MQIHVKNYKNPRYIDDSNNRVDLDINTEEYGWIPTSIILDDDDQHEHILEIKEWLNNNKTAIAPYSRESIPIEDVLSEVFNRITEARDDALYNENASVETSDGTVWQADPNSMRQLNDALTIFSAAGGTPEGFVWRDANNVNHPADLELLISIASARAQQVQAIWERSWELKDALKVAYSLGDRVAMDSLSW